MTEVLCGNCPRVTPAARFTVAWDPYAGWAVLDGSGRLVTTRKRQEAAFSLAEGLLDRAMPEGEALLTCSTCPYLDK